ncbi:MAG TPA: hypothetical protein VFA07_10770 [Chthonomonadaceae bacterium]|nr:hypothetical protein [Chthonomonadaceae bacterium]
MPLSDEDKQRIYEEELERIRIRKELEQQEQQARSAPSDSYFQSKRLREQNAPPPDETAPARFYLRVVCVFICGWVLISIVANSCHSSSPRPTPSERQAPPASATTSISNPAPLPPPAAPAQFDDSPNVAQDLAKIDTNRDVDENDPKVKEMDAALNSIHDKTGATNPQIGRVLVFCQQRMQEGGVYQSLIDVANGLDESMPGGQKWNLADIAGTYVTLTVQLKKHENDVPSVSRAQ